MKLKRFIAALCTLSLVCMLSATAFADKGNVTYDEGAKQVIFAPGSDYSPTDLFPNFKDVMPGDSLIQQITVKNDEKNNVKIKIYMRSLGAHDDEMSQKFLSELSLRVKTSEQNDMAYMFDAYADETAQLTDWVCLGTLYSGGVVNLDVMLDVPTSLDNSFKQLVGYLDWQFMIEELPVEDSDPTPPDTGDDFNIIFWISLMCVSAGLIIVILVVRRKKDKEQQITE